MGVIRDTYVSAEGGPTASGSHTVNANADRVVYLIVRAMNTLGDAGLGTVSYAGQTPTTVLAIGSGNNRLGLYRLLAPPTGSNSFSATATGSGSPICRVTVVGYSGAHQVTPEADTDSYSASGGTSSSLSLTSEVGGMALDGILISNYGVDPGPLSVGGGQTVLDTGEWNPGPRATDSGVSEEAGATSVTMSWSFSTTDELRHVACTIMPAPQVRGRAIAYAIDVWDSDINIVDIQGRVVPYNEVVSDVWGRLDGWLLPTSQVATSFVDDPVLFYVEGVSYDDERNALTLQGAPDDFADQLIKRLANTGGGA